LISSPKRIFDIDIEHCPNCGGSLKIIACPEPRRRAAIEDPPVIVKILSHLGCPPAPRRPPLRSDSIYSRQTEKPKPVANASRPSPPKQQRDFHQTERN
jgi:hypothetical protein